MTALEAVGLDALARRPATALSGGQQQRVALARALIREPDVLLLDEPLSNLDAKLREQMREEIRAIQQKIGITTVFVTHDQSEALAISDLILLMDEGRIVEFGDPQHLYDAPQTSYGAHFIGVSNHFRGTFVGNGEIEFMETRVPHTGTEAFATGDALIVFLRPESIVLTRAPRNGRRMDRTHRPAHLPGRRLGLHGAGQRPGGAGAQPRQGRTVPRRRRRLPGTGLRHHDRAAGPRRRPGASVVVTGTEHTRTTTQRGDRT